MGFIRQEENGKYALSEGAAQYGFAESEDGTAHLEILRESILDAAKRSPAWFDRSDDAHFESMIVSVSRAEYRRLLQRLKSDLVQWVSDLETHDADSLVRVNVQVSAFGQVKSCGLRAQRDA